MSKGPVEDFPPKYLENWLIPSQFIVILTFRRRLSPASGSWLVTTTESGHCRNNSTGATGPVFCKVSY